MRRHTSPRAASRLQQSGYALLLMLVLLTMGILFTVVNQVSLVGMKWSRAQGGSAVLAQAREALIGYAITYRDSHPGEVFGYLPCPDADGDGGAETANDDGNCGAANQVVIGLLPYRTLGLNDLRDASSECLWYAISPNYKAGMNKVEPMNWDSRGQIRILDSDGITMLADPVNGTEGGAVAVVFAAGSPLSNNTAGRGSDASKPCGNSGKPNWSAFLESAVFDLNGNSIANPFIVTKGTIESAANNDQIAWITPKDIFSRVLARGDFPAFMNSGIGSILGELDNAIGSHPPAAGNNLPSINPFGGGTSENNFYDNWKNNFRYLTCPTGTYCYDIESQSCDGVLLFSGQSMTGSPRAVIPALSTFFEDIPPSANALSLASGATTDYSGGAAMYSDAGRSADVIKCLTPQTITTVSFDSNLAQFSQTESQSNMVTPSIANNRVRLGVNSTSTVGFGCFWYPTVLPMKNGIRAYFQFRLPTLPGANVGSFTFAIADAATNPTPEAMCGNSGESLGYAGHNGTTAPVNYPKIGIEFDKISNPGRNDPASDHATFVYWGSSSDNGSTLLDDNQHGAGGGADPTNPVSGSGMIQNPILVGTTVYHVRLDIVRNYDASSRSGTYTLNAYITDSGSSPASCPISPSFSQLDDDLNTLCPALDDSELSYGHLTDTITINDIPGNAALKQVYLGFTTGQEGSNQRVNITNFFAAAR